MRIVIVIVVCLWCIPFAAVAQTGSINKKDVLNISHERVAHIEEFTKTAHQLFYAKVYAVEKPAINKTQHWFLQILDKNKDFLNNGNIELDGYLKTDKNIKLNYLSPVFAMCNQGKFVIGFVKVKQGGTWVLNLTITSDDMKKDTISLEMHVEEPKTAQ